MTTVPGVDPGPGPREQRVRGRVRDHPPELGAHVLAEVGRLHRRARGAILDQGRDQDHVQTDFSLTLSMKESAFLSHRCASGKTLYEKGLMMIFPDRGS